MEEVFAIKSNYYAMLAANVDREEALNRIKNNYYDELVKKGCENLYWFALAEAEVQCGILCDETKTAAMSFCTDSSPEAVKAKNIIQGFKPAEKPGIFQDTVLQYGETTFKKGDVFAYKSGDNFFVFRVIDIDEFYLSDIMHELGKASFAVACLYDINLGHIPDMSEIQNMELKFARICDSSDKLHGHITHVPYIFYFDGSFNESEAVTFVGNDGNYPEIDAMVLNADYIDIAYEQFLPLFFEKIMNNE